MDLADILRRKEALDLRRSLRRAPDRRVTTYYLDAAYAHRNEIPAMREAQGFWALYSNMELELWPEERFCGTIKPLEAAGFHYGTASWVDHERIETIIRQQDLADNEAQRLRAMAQWLEESRYQGKDAPIFSQEEKRSIAACAATSTWFGGHMVLDYRRILSTGLGGYRSAIAEKADTPFYRALAVQLEALQILIRRYAQKARACAECSGYDRERMTELAGMLDRIAAEPPVSFEEALQLVWLMHIANGADSFGRFDSYLAPFYEADIRLGRITRQQAYDDLVDIWIKIEDADQIQNMTIGGKDAYSDLTLLCLEVTRDVGLKGPNLCLRIARDMPDTLWDAALSCLASGIGLPALYHEEAYLNMLRRAGYAEDLAQDYCLAGCSQVMISGQCNFINDIGLYNMAKVMELTLFGGKDPLTGIQIGPRTPGLDEVQSFDELYAAFEKQNRYFVKLETDIHDKDAVYRSACEGYTMRSLFTRGCIESGKGIFEGGALYNNIELEIIGITNAADSLYAVKKTVFEDKRFTCAQMLDMLRANFSGSEAQRLYLANKVAKFGNDEEEVDALRARIAQDTYRMFNETPAVLGGVYVPGEVIFTAHEHTGAMVGATPDGRLAHTVLADSMGASQGKDRNGPTALMNSVGRIKAGDYLLTTPVLNLRFLSSVFRDANKTGAMRGLLETYFRMGGMQLQINVCDGDTLRKAMQRPEEYRSLVVRVGGYSDYFVNLSRALQQEILQRTEQMV